jgi:Mce-associated membrane protein
VKRVVLVCAALILVGVGGTLLWSHHRSAAADTARVEVIGVAPMLVENLLSYNSDTVDDDLARAAEGASGTFQDSFAEFGSKTVAPQSKEQGISTKARVVDVGVRSVAADRAELLMFVDQITTSIARPAPASTSSRVEVTLDRVDGTWLVSAMIPV